MAHSDLENLKKKVLSIRNTGSTKVYEDRRDAYGNLAGMSAKARYPKAWWEALQGQINRLSSTCGRPDILESFERVKKVWVKL